MKKNFYAFPALCLLSLLLIFTACNKEKQTLQLKQKPTVTTENAKTTLAKTETTATTYGKIVTVAFSTTTDGFSTTFTNSSVIIDKKNYAIDSYDWDFGDGTTETRSDNKPFTHDYKALGNYNVKLTANVVDALTHAPVDDGIFVSTKRINVTAVIPTADFTVSYSSDGVTAIFNNTSTNGLKYNWDFGDKETDTIQNPTHLYAKEGTYTVKLTVTSKTATMTSISKTIIIDSTPDFYCKLGSDKGINDSRVFINSKSLLPSDLVTWDFSDGNALEISTSHGDPNLEYPANGTFLITLKVTRSTSGKTYNITKRVSINALNPFANCSSSYSGSVVQFTNLSSNFVHQGILGGYSWDFGDGKTSSDENPRHDFITKGARTVTLTVWNANNRKSTLYILITI